MPDLLKSVIQDLINDNPEQAQVSLHEYIVGKTQQACLQDNRSPETQGLAEGQEIEMTDAQQAKIVKKVLMDAESLLPYKCRYKSYDYFESSKEVVWITQESDPADGKEAAKTIARAIRKAGLKGWTVMVTIRDDYRGRGKLTKWQGKAKS
jgi:hypothetical protein